MSSGRTVARALSGLACAACAFALPSPAAAQEDGREPAAIVEVGGAGEWSLGRGGARYGPSLAVETTPVERWLEIEAGVAPLFGRGGAEWDVDLLFKKPFTLSSKVELMVGVGPSWSHAVCHGRSDDQIGAEAALDLMVWPWRNRRFGWYVEPSLGRSFFFGHERALGMSAGLLIPVG